MKEIIALAEDLAYTYDSIELAYACPEFSGNEEFAPEVMFADFVKNELLNGSRSNSFAEIVKAENVTAEELIAVIESKGREILAKVSNAKIY